MPLELIMSSTGTSPHVSPASATEPGPFQNLARLVSIAKGLPPESRPSPFQRRESSVDPLAVGVKGGQAAEAARAGQQKPFKGLRGKPVPAGGRTYTSRYRGVHQTLPTRRWEAQFRRNGKPTSLGCFDNEEEAARAYDRVMIWCELHQTESAKGALTNFMLSEYDQEIPWLKAITQDELIEALRSDGRRQAAHRQTRNRRETTGSGTGGDGLAGDQARVREEPPAAPSAAPAGASPSSAGKRLGGAPLECSSPASDAAWDIGCGSGGVLAAGSAAAEAGCEDWRAGGDAAARAAAEEQEAGPLPTPAGPGKDAGNWP